MTYEELIKKFEGASFEGILNVCAEAVNDAMAYFKKINLSDKDSVNIIFNIVMTTITVDGQLTKGELSLVAALFGIEDGDAVANYCANVWNDLSDMVETTDRIVDSCPADVKGALVALCLGFLAVDGKVADIEKGYLGKLIQ